MIKKPIFLPTTTPAKRSRANEVRSDSDSSPNVTWPTAIAQTLWAYVLLEMKLNGTDQNIPIGQGRGIRLKTN